MERLLQDLRFGLRSLGKNRGFTALAVITLTLGIGANTAVFSMVNALLLRPYPFRDLERLVLISRAGNNSGSETRVAPADLMELQQQKKMFESVTAFQYKLWNITEAGETEGIVACAVQPNFFDVIGIRAALGRTLLPEEGVPGRDQVALMNHGYWKRRFGADPNVIGRTVTMNGRSYTIIGVMPADLQYSRAADFWIPLAFTPREATEYNEQSLHLLARLRPGASIEQGQAELHGAIARLKQLYQNAYQNRDLTLLRLRDEQFALLGVPFLMLQASAIFVFLLASVNLVNLLFARLVGRQKEVAIRATLGASRARLGQLFSSETVPLALLAGAIALAGSAWSVELIRDSINPNYTKWVAGWERIQVDERVLGFALVLTVVIGIIFGIGAAWRSGRFDLNEVLKQSGGRASSGAGRQRLRSTLVVVQMVFATVLLVGAALMAKGFQRLTDI
jgi:putative ABC transport system permease protein